MIIAPTCLSFIYEINQEMTFYVSAAITMISFFTMSYVWTWENAKDIGKVALYKDHTTDCKDRMELELTEINSPEKECELRDNGGKEEQVSTESSHERVEEEMKETRVEIKQETSSLQVWKLSLHNRFKF